MLQAVEKQLFVQSSAWLLCTVSDARHMYVMILGGGALGEHPSACTSRQRTPTSVLFALQFICVRGVLLNEERGRLVWIVDSY